jgi:hypothetical protein
VSSFRTSGNKVLCVLYLDNTCPGYVEVKDLYVDDEGDTWDVCRWCKALEDELVASRL